MVEVQQFVVHNRFGIVIHYVMVHQFGIVMHLWDCGKFMVMHYVMVHQFGIVMHLWDCGKFYGSSFWCKGRWVIVLVWQDILSSA